MTSILCLAHYCDLHGPTPLMVTEGLPVPCSACYDGPEPPQSAGGQPAGAAADALTEALRRMALPAGPHRSASVPVSDQEAQAHRAALRRAPQMAVAPMTAVETPPVSPRRVPDQQATGAAHHRRDSSFRKTYDDYVTKRASPCDNCAMTLPRRQEVGGGGGGGGGGDGPGNGQSGGGGGSRSNRDAARSPTLRTRAPIARVYGGLAGGDASPPASHTTCSSDNEADDGGAPAHHHHPHHVYTHRRTGTITSTTSRSTASSSSRLDSHTHYLDYTSTHEPVVPSSFSGVRASCLRTLSFEMLPRNPAPPGSSSGFFGGSASSSSSAAQAAAAQAAAATPLISPQTPSFVTTQSAGAVASGGPIFFGDPVTGYTTAYIFRIPDIHARGHKRVYAFLALSTHRERLAMKTFGFMSAAFHELAAWVQQLAEAEAERALSESSAASSPVVAANPVYGSSAFSAPPAATSAHHPDLPGGGSSFLAAAGAGLSRRMGSGFGGSGASLRARGLAELVGLPDFFIELHSRFVRLLLELGVMLNS